ncbi:DNA-damage-repair/toleration protein [Abeliophyllum distichum]|uniref:DNA-damage-repair/toleration protein n=1 Tax=Abeliophyllum distichum TaxID=126358 RepID=A0ABD1QKJ8_9LAMI
MEISFHYPLPQMIALPLYPPLMCGRAAPRWPYLPYANLSSSSQTILRTQQQKSKLNSTISKRPITHSTFIISDEHTNPNPATALFQPILVSINSSVIKEYDSA